MQFILISVLWIEFSSAPSLFFLLKKFEVCISSVSRDRATLSIQRNLLHGITLFHTIMYVLNNLSFLNCYINANGPLAIIRMATIGIVAEMAPFNCRESPLAQILKKKKKKEKQKSSPFAFPRNQWNDIVSLIADNYRGSIPYINPIIKTLY